MNRLLREVTVTPFEALYFLLTTLNSLTFGPVDKDGYKLNLLTRPHALTFGLLKNGHKMNLDGLENIGTLSSKQLYCKIHL